MTGQIYTFDCCCNMSVQDEQQAVLCAKLSLWFDSAGVTVRSYRVIYDLLDDMRAAMEGKLAALSCRLATV